MAMRKTLIIALTITAGTPALAQSAPAPAPAPVQSPPAAPDGGQASAVTLSEGYVIGVGDVVDVTLVGQPEYAARSQVQVDGTIQLPYLNTLNVRDQTVLQVRAQIASKLKEGGFYKDPLVNVGISSFASRFVVVLGQVGAPGIVPIDRAYRLSELLARVGGPRESGADEVTIRRASGEERKYAIEDVATGGPDQDPIINPGDKLYVGPAPTFFLQGQVRNVGNFRLRPGMTVRTALAQGGGVAERGSEKRVKLFRQGKRIPATLDTLVEKGDIIVIGERFF